MECLNLDYKLNVFIIKIQFAMKNYLIINYSIKSNKVTDHNMVIIIRKDIIDYLFYNLR